MPDQKGVIMMPTYNEHDNILKLTQQILDLPILVDILF